MNYVGYSFNDPAWVQRRVCYFEIKNCRAYGNRTYGIVDEVMER